MVKDGSNWHGELGRDKGEACCDKAMMAVLKDANHIMTICLNSASTSTIFLTWKWKCHSFAKVDTKNKRKNDIENYRI